MSIYEAVLKNAEPFFAWDVLSWLFIAMILAIAIVLIDLSCQKKQMTQFQIQFKKNLNLDG